MTERQIKALNQLYAATIEVMEAFQPETVTSRQKKEALVKLLENFLITESQKSSYSCNDISEDKNVGISKELNVAVPSPPPAVIADEQLPGETSKPNSDTSDIETPSPTNNDSDTDSKDQKICYAINTLLLDGSRKFKRVTSKDNVKLGTTYPFVLTLGNSIGTFRVECDLEFAKSNSLNIFLDNVVKIAEGSKSIDEGSSVVTTTPGEVIKEGKMWKITKPAIIAYE